MDRRRWAFVIAGLVVALALAGVVGSFASGSPDGLERVAIDQGFADRESPHPAAEGPLGGYGVEGVEDERLSTGLAGAIGVLVTFAFGFGLVWLIRRRRRAGSASG